MSLCSCRISGVRHWRTLITSLAARSPAGWNHPRTLHVSSFLLGTNKINMPSLSPTMTEGTIVKWLKNEGDPVSAGDVLCEIQTDKAVVALESDEEGILAKIIVPENSVDVKVGTLIALTVDEGDDWKSVEVPAGSSSSSTPSPVVSTASSSNTAAAPASLPEGVYRVNMPSLSPTMTEGTITSWLKKEGDVISPGDVLCEIQTDKAVVSMEWDEEGILAKILVPEGTSEVKVGTLIALTADEGVDWKNVQVPVETSSPSATPTPSVVAAAAPAPIQSGQPAHHGSHSLVDERGLGPAVKNYLRFYGLSPDNVKATGPHGLVTKGDVLSHVKSNNLAPVSQEVAVPAPVSAPKKSLPSRSPLGSSVSFVDLPVTNMRRTIAKRLLESKSTIPHSYGMAEADVQSITNFRKTLAAEGIKVSVNDILVKCAGNALGRVPAVNRVWVGNQISQPSSVDVSVAVSTPNGLITPIVFDVAGLDVLDIAQSVRSLAGKARDGKLQPHEFIGGSFSISNLGMFGIHSFSAIINPPQTGILAVGGSISGIDEQGKPKTTVKLTLSYDRRAVDEEDASKFLAVLKDEIERVNLISMGIFSLEGRKEEL